MCVIEASVRPVTRSPPDEIRSAKKPARTPAKSERKSATKRATARRGNRSIANSAGQTRSETSRRAQREHSRIAQRDLEPSGSAQLTVGLGSGVAATGASASVAAPQRWVRTRDPAASAAPTAKYSGYFESEWYWNTTLVRARGNRHADEARGEHRGLDRLAVDRRPPVWRVRLLQHHPGVPRRRDRAREATVVERRRCSSRR